MPRNASGKETGWISKNAFQEGALAADDLGREATADGYIIPRMLHRNIRAKLDLIAELEKRIKALEKAKEAAAPATSAEPLSEEQPEPVAVEEKPEETETPPQEEPG